MRAFIDLKGFDDVAPVAPGVAGFLRALGVAASRIPVGLAERAGLYRSLSADRRMLDGPALRQRARWGDSTALGVFGWLWGAGGEGPEVAQWFTVGFVGVFGDEFADAVVEGFDGVRA
ncbi:hypothetical protein EV192_104543 [Actinocrispum wychmicini]|uniref:Uncharacterized protein n=1 Tax=Actinocrispum wychmicini TaxID=1213861 RepID=A0A4V2S7F7_9PSEU|nr:hypothetical protein EV192_104543 [Actinocrispum wychmicini]